MDFTVGKTCFWFHFVFCILRFTILCFAFCLLPFCVLHFVFYHFVFCILCSPDWREHVHVPHPVDVDGGAKVEIGLDGGGDLGEERHPVLLVSATHQPIVSSIFVTTQSEL